MPSNKKSNNRRNRWRRKHAAPAASMAAEETHIPTASPEGDCHSSVNGSILETHSKSSCKGTKTGIISSGTTEAPFSQDVASQQDRGSQDYTPGSPTDAENNLDSDTEGSIPTTAITTPTEYSRATTPEATEPAQPVCEFDWRFDCLNTKKWCPVHNPYDPDHAKLHWTACRKDDCRFHRGSYQYRWQNY